MTSCMLSWWVGNCSIPWQVWWDANRDGSVTLMSTCVRCRSFLLPSPTFGLGPSAIAGVFIGSHGIWSTLVNNGGLTPPWDSTTLKLLESQGTLNDMAKVAKNGRSFFDHFDWPLHLVYSSQFQVAYLIVDPHYTGKDELKTILSKGWVGWKHLGAVCRWWVYGICDWPCVMIG